MQPSRPGEEFPMHRFRCVIARPERLERGEAAAGLGKDEVGRGDVPVAGIPGDEADIDRTVRDAHETQRQGRDALDALDRPGPALEAVDERLWPGDPGAGKRRTARDPDGLAVAHRPATADGLVEQLVRRRVHDAEHWLAFDQERDRDRPVRMAGEEGAGAVDRVDDPDPAALYPRRIVGRLL